MPPRGRLILKDQSYTIDDDVELQQVPHGEVPPIEEQGEPWNWTKPGPRPRGWPGPDHPTDEPGPYDGRWSRGTD